MMELKLVKGRVFFLPSRLQFLEDLASRKKICVDMHKSAKWNCWFVRVTQVQTRCVCLVDEPWRETWVLNGIFPTSRPLLYVLCC